MPSWRLSAYCSMLKRFRPVSSDGACRLHICWNSVTSCNRPRGSQSSIRIWLQRHPRCQVMDAGRIVRRVSGIEQERRKSDRTSDGRSARHIASRNMASAAPQQSRYIEPMHLKSRTQQTSEGCSGWFCILRWCRTVRLGLGAARFLVSWHVGISQSGAVHLCCCPPQAGPMCRVLWAEGPACGSSSAPLAISHSNKFRTHFKGVATAFVNIHGSC